MAWVGFSTCVGAGVGSAVTGLVIDRAGADGGYLAATVCAVLAAAKGLAALPSLGSAAPRDAPGISVI